MPAVSDSDPFADQLADAVANTIADAHAESVANDYTHAYSACPYCHALLVPVAYPESDDDPTADTAY